MMWPDKNNSHLSNRGPVTPLALAALRSRSLASMISASEASRLEARCRMMSALSPGSSPHSRLLPPREFLASTSTLVPCVSR